MLFHTVNILMDTSSTPRDFRHPLSRIAFYLLAAPAFIVYFGGVLFEVFERNGITQWLGRRQALPEIVGISWMLCILLSPISMVVVPIHLYRHPAKRKLKILFASISICGGLYGIFLIWESLCVIGNGRGYGW